ncbi:MAG TPA: dihydrofolate reductase family protein [Sphingomicrobium sp.]|nr:dihydrofolate reductase family protein [Sphingomicrobium sp.]
MRKLTGAVFLSLDGVMQAPGGPQEDPSGRFRFGGWTHPFSDESSFRPMACYLIEPEYDLLLGKRTYDIFAAFWPYNQEGSIGEKFQRINKYVLTHSNEPLRWDNSQKISGETADAVAGLKRSEGRDLLIQGSSTLYVPLLAAGLIDRLILMIFPVLLGEGKRIFDGKQKPGALKLVDHSISDKGVTFLAFEPAGEVPTGSFASKEPSSEELERRAKIDAGSW